MASSFSRPLFPSDHSGEVLSLNGTHKLLASIRGLIALWAAAVTSVDTAVCESKAFDVLEETVPRYPGVKKILLDTSDEKSGRPGQREILLRILVDEEYDHHVDLLLRGHLARIGARFRTTIRFTISGR